MVAGAHGTSFPQQGSFARLGGYQRSRRSGPPLRNRRRRFRRAQPRAVQSRLELPAGAGCDPALAWRDRAAPADRGGEPSGLAHGDRLRAAAVVVRGRRDRIRRAADARGAASGGRATASLRQALFGQGRARQFAHLFGSAGRRADGHPRDRAHIAGRRGHAEVSVGAVEGAPQRQSLRGDMEGDDALPGDGQQDADHRRPRRPRRFCRPDRRRTRFPLSRAAAQAARRGGVRRVVRQFLAVRDIRWGGSLRLASDALSEAVDRDALPRCADCVLR